MSIQNQLGPRPGGNASSLNIIAPTLLTALPGTFCSINVLVAGSTPGAIYDSTSLSGNTIANQIAVVPNAITTQPLAYTWPCANGIVIVPGEDQVLSAAITGNVLHIPEGIAETVQDHQRVAVAGTATGP
jgi:hypothetical protein